MFLEFVSTLSPTDELAACKIWSMDNLGLSTYEGNWIMLIVVVKS